MVQIERSELPPEPDKIERLQRHNMVYEVDHLSQYIANFVHINWSIVSFK